MSKLIIALPLIALLAIGSVFLLSEKDVSDIKGLTIYDWQYCFQKLPSRQCDQLSDSTQLNSCYAAARATSDLVWDGASQELQACKNFYSYFQHAQAGDLLNVNNNYVNCFLDSKSVSAAKKSNFYYSNIYAPKYITCAGLKA